MTRGLQQWTASTLLLMVAGAHLPLIGEHLDEAPYVGWLFVLLTVGCAELAVAVLFVDDPGVWAVSGLVCLVALLAFLISRTVGLPQIGDDIGNWTEPLGFPAVASELGLTTLAALRLRGPGQTVVASVRGR